MSASEDFLTVRPLFADKGKLRRSQMAVTVNLDALIHREEYETAQARKQTGDPPRTITISELERQGSFGDKALRKPVFQRATSAWSPKQIAGFIETFLNEELI